MAIKVAQPVNGQQAGETYSGPAALQPWLLAHGYVYDDTNTTDLADNTDTTPANDPTLSSNREDPGDAFQFGTDATLAPRFESIEPDSGPAAGSTAVVISGDNFTGVTGVSFDGVAGTAFSVVDDNTIHVTTPAGTAGPADILLDKGATDTTVTGGYTYE
jgi:hypothetical protein